MNQSLKIGILIFGIVFLNVIFSSIIALSVINSHNAEFVHFEESNWGEHSLIAYKHESYEDTLNEYPLGYKRRETISDYEIPVLIKRRSCDRYENGSLQDCRFWKLGTWKGSES
ncbi:MAG: hypothetical protein HY376_03135 [Candidatus Blackburnbacteria bacterium]|nr:hypothetical protein [Candidatus Blackburnbacteria bacterium]